MHDQTANGNLVEQSINIKMLEVQRKLVADKEAALEEEKQALCKRLGKVR